MFYLFNSISGHIAHSDSELSGRLHVDVVDARSDADDDSKRLELFEVFLRQYDGVPHERADRFVQHLYI